MVSGSEFARLLGEFQSQYLAENDSDAAKSLKHHEIGISAQKTYQTQVMEALGNPFQGDVEELVNIATGECVLEEVRNELKSIESVSQNHCNTFVKTVIEDRTVYRFLIPSRKILCCCLTTKAQAKSKVKAARKCTEKRLQSFQPFLYCHSASKRRPRRIFYARKPALPTISLGVGKAKIRKEVRSLDMC